MRYLADTLALLWWCADDPGLSTKWNVRITDPANEILVSTATLWELTIKAAVGTLHFDGGIGPFARALARDHGFTLLPIGVDCLEALATLPPHHGVPFDRMLIAQCLDEGATAITDDRQWARYRGLKVDW